MLRSHQLLPEFLTLFHRGNYHEIISIFSNRIDSNPNEEDHIYRGIAYFLLGKIEKAREDYEKAIEINPDYADAYANLGDLYRYTHNFDAALLNYTLAIEKSPEPAVNYVLRGMLYYKLGNKDEAFEDFDYAILISTDKEFSHRIRGVYYILTENNDDALNDFNTIIDLDQNGSEAYLTRAMLYLNQKKFKQALKDCKKAIELNPDLAFSYANQAFIYTLQERYDKAISLISRILNNNEMAECYYTRGKARMAKACELAEPLIASWHRGMPSVPIATSIICSFVDAETDLERALELNPNHVHATSNHINCGIIKLNLGKIDEAFSHLNKAIERDPLRALAYDVRSRFYSLLGETEKASADLASYEKCNHPQKMENILSFPHISYLTKFSLLKDQSKPLENQHDYENKSELRLKKA